MNLTQWFSIPIWHTVLNCDFNIIKQGCLRLQAESSGVVRSNAGGWHSDDLNMEDITEFKDLYLELIQNINNVSSRLDPHFSLNLQDSWVNINGPHHYNIKHCHARNTISGCIYVSVNQNSGPIRFHNPSLQLHYPIQTTSNLFFETADYKPVVGLLVLFPSWLEHEVLPSPKSSEDRISISFNLLQSGF